MKCPLAAVVSAYAAGLLLAEIFQPPLAVLFAISFMTLGFALLGKSLRPFLIWPLLALAGWTNLTFHTAALSPDDLRSLIGDTNAMVSVRGVLAERPKLKLSERNGETTEHSLALLRVSEWQRDGDWRPATGEIIVMTPAAMPENFFSGQSVEIAGVITPPPPPLAEGLFDYREYLRTRGIHYQVKTDSTNDWQLRAPILSRPPLTDRFLNWSQHTLALGLPAEDEPLKLLWAMTLGWRTAFTGDVSEPFLRAGTMHMFAIDGLRIALISGMLVAVLRALQISRAWCGIIAIPLIWFYTAATGWESAAVRASVMMTIVLGGWSLKRPSNLVNSLAAAAFIILLWEPRQLFEAGFQLSFCVMLVIALLLPPLNNLIDRLLKHDPLVPDELLPRWRRWGESLLRPLARYAALAFAAWVGSIPLSAKYFHLFSPVSTPANILAVPLGTFALMSNLGALVCGAWLPWATELFNHSAWFFMSAMTKVSVLATKIPGAYFYVPAPSWWTIAIYYAALIAFLGGWLKNRLQKLASTFVLAGIALVYLWRWELSRNETQVTVLPLNGGHAVFADADGRTNDWLVNCGNANAVEFTLTPFLRAQGVNNISRLILTEGEGRVIGGAELLDTLFGVDELWTGEVPFRSSASRDLVAAFEGRNHGDELHHKVFHLGDVTGCWQVLWPDEASHFSRADDNALVLLGNFHGTRILLLSDLGREGQSALLEHTNNLTADIVVSGLPGSGEPLCNALIAAAKPKMIIIADSEFPATRRAGRELRDRLEQTKIPVIYTREACAVTIVARPGGWELHSMNGIKFGN